MVMSMKVCHTQNGSWISIRGNNFQIRVTVLFECGNDIVRAWRRFSNFEMTF